MENMMYERSQLEKRIKAGEVDSRDLQIAAVIAKQTTSAQDRVNFAKVKRILNEKEIKINGGEE